MFSSNRRVEFGMCDVAGILFYSKIFELAHSVYEEFVLESDLNLNVFENTEFAIPLVSTSAEYYKPIFLHEILSVQLKVMELGKSSFQLQFGFYGKDEVLKAKVKTAHVFVNKSDFKKTSIHSEFFSLLEKHKG